MFHTPDALDQMTTTYWESLHYIKIDQLKITDKSGNPYLPDTTNKLYLKYKLKSLKFNIITKNEISKIRNRKHLYEKVFINQP